VQDEDGPSFVVDAKHNSQGRLEDDSTPTGPGFPGPVGVEPKLAIDFERRGGDLRAGVGVGIDPHRRQFVKCRVDPFHGCINAAPGGR
jgi:hypothetical protein